MNATMGALEERIGKATRWHEPERVAKSRRVLRGREARVASDARAHDAPLLHELTQPTRRRVGRQRARANLRLRQRPEREEHVVDPVGMLGRMH